MEKLYSKQLSDYALPSFVDGNKEVLFTRKVPLSEEIVPDKFLELNETNKAWKHINIWGFPYEMLAKEIKTKIYWVQNQGKFCRYILPKAITLQYKDLLVDKYNEILSFWGNEQIIAIDKGTVYLKCAVLEKIFNTESEYKADMENPSSVDYTEFCNEIFADG